MTRMINESKFKDFNRIFEPSRIAIAGVSAEGFSFGSGILLSLLSIGFQGEIFPVNPRGGVIRGLKIYESIDAVPGTIDLGIIAVPARHVPRAVEECRKKGAAAVEILSSGFKEMGTPDGIELENQLKKIASESFRIIGPNCFGIYNPKSALTILPGPDLSREAGPVGFISQSGGMTIDFALIGKWRGVRFSKMISFGNGVDLRETELLEYLGSDPETEIIGMYIEGLDNGREFFEVLKSVCENKPVIIVKGGRSDTGSRAAMSHTASIAGKAELWGAVFRQCNAVQAMDLKEVVDYSLAFSLLPEREYRGISLIGGGGALGVAAADAASASGMVIPEFNAAIQREIMAMLPGPGSSAKNPVDVANPYVTPDVLKKTLLASARCEAVDIQIVIQLIYHYNALAISLGKESIRSVTPAAELAAALCEAARESGKPVVAVLPDYRQERESLEIAALIREMRYLLTEGGIPVFDETVDAIKSIQAVSDYYTRKGLRALSVR